MRQSDSDHMFLDVIRIPESFQCPKCFRTYNTIGQARECLRRCQEQVIYTSQKEKNE